MDSKEIPDMTDDSKWYSVTINFRIISTKQEYNNIIDAIKDKSSATLTYRTLGSDQYILVKYPTDVVEAYVIQHDKIGI